MDAHPLEDIDALAARTTSLIAHLDGALDATMLDAIAGVWSTLEHAAADRPAHARAVRSRLFWETLSPGDVAGTTNSVVHELPARWHEPQHEHEGAAEPEPEAEAA
jgi:hypothetical protein